MTAEQVKAAFGDGVQLADFIGCEGDGDKDNASTSIKVKFTAVDAIAANHPYLIKVETAISSFSVDGVTISPDEENAIVQMDKTSGRNPVYNSFVGTYNPSTIIPVGGLFLNSNKFYYSNGKLSAHILILLSTGLKRLPMNLRFSYLLMVMLLLLMALVTSASPRVYTTSLVARFSLRMVI